MLVNLYRFKFVNILDGRRFQTRLYSGTLDALGGKGVESVNFNVQDISGVKFDGIGRIKVEVKVMIGSVLLPTIPVLIDPLMFPVFHSITGNKLPWNETVHHAVKKFSSGASPFDAVKSPAVRLKLHLSSGAAIWTQSYILQARSNWNIYKAIINRKRWMLIN